MARRWRLPACRCSPRSLGHLRARVWHARCAGSPRAHQLTSILTLVLLLFEAELVGHGPHLVRHVIIYYYYFDC